MSDINNLSDTIEPKSDQLNADDLLGGSRVITITKVVRYDENGVGAFALNYEGDSGRPFKPCKTMRKIIIHEWGADGDKFIGQQLNLYNDESVIYAGKDVGGVRISHMTGIQKTLKVSLNATRGRKQQYIIEPMQSATKPTWPDAKFTSGFAKFKPKLIDGSMTNEQLITQFEMKGALTEDMKAQIRAVEMPAASELNEEQLFEDKA